MDERLEFEVEAPSVKAAQKMIAEIREIFGEEIFVKIKIVGEDKSKVFETLNDAIAKTAEELKAKLRRD